MEEFFIYLLKSAGLLTAFLVFYFLLLKKDTSFVTNRRFLLGGLVTSAILPAVYFSRTVIVKSQPSQFQFSEATFPVAEIAIQEPIASPLEIIAGIYILGVIVMIIRLLLQLLSLSRILLSGKFTRQENANFIETARHIAPFSFLNYIVYNPALHSENELEYILKHEKAHVKQRHTIDVLLANLNLIYQWFNPFAWLYIKSIQQNLEFIADREAVKKASCKKEYQNALVKISVGNSNLALTNNFYQSLIKKRIVMLNRSSSNKYSILKTVLIVPALFAFIFFFNIKTVAQIQSEEKEKVEETGYRNFSISFRILNTLTEKNINSFNRLMQEYNVQLNFENITRNEAGLITNITASFIDKNNNSSGSITRQNEEGIKGFVFNYSEEEGSGFGSLDAPVSEAHALLRDIGNQPLVILEGKNYNISELDGKTISILGEVSAVPSSQAIKIYGNTAKDGALIITKGKLIQDFYGELKKIDYTDENAVQGFIRFKNNEKPTLIGLHKNARTSQPGKNNSGSNSAITIKNLTIPGKNPIYIVNGKVLGTNAIIDTINTENITGVNVLKGYSATAVYGKEAKDGAIILTTKNPSDTSAYSYSFSADSLIYINASQNVKNKTYALKTGDDINYKVGQNRFYITSRDSTSNPLYIVDGKEMDENFQMSSIGRTGVDSIYVIKGTAAIKKYGDKAKGGAVEITTGNQRILVPAARGKFEIVKASSTEKELNQAINRIKKKTGIDVEFKNVKRNRDGVIRSIHVLASHQGENVTLTVSESGGINDIYIGKVNNKIRVTTNP